GGGAARTRRAGASHGGGPPPPGGPVRVRPPLAPRRLDRPGPVSHPCELLSDFPTLDASRLEKGNRRWRKSRSASRPPNARASRRRAGRFAARWPPPRRRSGGGPTSCTSSAGRSPATSSRTGPEPNASCAATSSRPPAAGLPVGADYTAPLRPLIPPDTFAPRYQGPSRGRAHRGATRLPAALGEEPSMKPSTISAACASAAIALGAGALVGWWLDIEPLRSVIPGRVATNPVTALALTAAGAALLLSAKPRRPAPARRLAQGLAALVLLVGGVRLGAYLSVWNVAMDDVLFPGRVDAVGSRMGPLTALSFILVGLALTLPRLG